MGETGPAPRRQAAGFVEGCPEKIPRRSPSAGLTGHKGSHAGESGGDQAAHRTLFAPHDSSRSGGGASWKREIGISSFFCASACLVARKGRPRKKREK